MNYKIPVVFPDVIVMASRVPSASISTDRFKQEFIAVSLAQERVVCTGEALIVSFDYKAQTKAPLPEIVTRVLKSVDAEYSQPPQKISKL